MRPAETPVKLYELPSDSVLQDVLRGLQQPQKELPARWFYDEVGSRLFEQICELDEYYLTRTEMAIMQARVAEMVALLGRGCLLIEYGSGSSKKTRLLLDHLPEPVAYVAIDISREHLLQATAALSAAYPGLEVLPLWADYTHSVTLPPTKRPPTRRVAYFPGSTVGNFYPPEVVAFLQRVAAQVGPGGGLLIGVDLKKDPAILRRAYNDRAGVTAAFNLNMLAHLNRALGANFQLEQFEHRALYNQEHGRIEMRLVARAGQTVHLDGRAIPFHAGEEILTEVSYKYSLADFAELAAEGGFQVGQVWTDEEQLFSVQYLEAI
ncbi:MAG: L-histidine N(alpha)-methyltransferase [Chloroflexota bacterium]